MSDMSRRDVVKFAAGLAVGAAATADSALGQVLGPGSGPHPNNGADELLALAVKSPTSFMLSDPEVFQIAGDGHSRDLYITSARDEAGKVTRVRIPSRSVRIFRADADVDDFTKAGELHWQFFKSEGRVKLKQPGQIVMVVREENTVRCYTMTPDLRC